MSDQALLQNEKPYFVNCDENDPDAVLHLAQRGAEYYSWQWTYHRYRFSAGDMPRDWEEYGALIAARTSTSVSHVAAMLLTFTVLEKLPKFQALVEELMHVPMHILRAIAENAFRIDPEWRENPQVWELLDDALTAYLTPRHPRQVLPTRKAIVQKVNRTLEEMNMRKPPKKEKKRQHYAKTRVQPGYSEISFDVDNARAEAIDLVIKKYAKDKELPLAEACAELLLNGAEVKVVMNTYMAQDVENAPMYLADGTVLTNTDWVTGIIRVTRDVEEAAKTGVDGYSVSPAVRALLEGRDGRCRFPGCDNKAVGADMDHRVNYEDGGPTHPCNLLSLCRHHHNLKTDQSVRYWIDPFTADVYWLFEDGTWIMDEAQGPLAPRQKNWLRTLNDLWEARYKNMWEEPQASETQELECAENGTSDDPPF